MTYKTGMRSAVCLAALIAGGAAHADVTAAEVWEDWKSQLSLYGEDNITIGAEETSSGVITVRGIGLRMVDDEATIEANMGDITFNEQSDGSVRVTMDDSYPVVITAEDGVVVTIMVTQTNLEMIVSGDPDAMDYDISADQYKIALQDVVDGDVTFTGDVEMVANDVRAIYETRLGDMRNISSTGTIGSLDLLVDFKVPGGNGEYFTGGGKVEGMQMQAEMAVPLDADFENPDNLINDGFSIAGGYVVDSANYVFDVNSEGEQFAGSVSTGSTTLTGEMNSETVSYDTQTADVAVSFQSAQFPIPFEFGMGEYGIGFQMPVGATEEPSDFATSFDLIDLTISDTLWNLFDAGNVLPRDPATIQFALAGKAKALFDMFDPAQAEAIESTDIPYEFTSVTLDKLKIMAAGALLTGDGAFTFDNTDMQTFAPMPRPEGEARIEIAGLNALLDNLVAMGLVPEADIMGPRMMMGMFARSTGDDQMETSVEVTADGQVKVNGNRVR
jgi:hypothetical protein